MLDADAFDGALIELEGGLSVDHHNNTKLLAAGGAGWLGKGLQPRKTYLVIRDARDQELDQASFAGFEVSEEEDAAAAFNDNQLTGSHLE